MVAVTLLSVIVLGLLAMFDQTQKAFRTSMTQTDVLQAGRALQEMLTRELTQIAAGDTWDATNFFVSRPVAEQPFTQLLPGATTGFSRAR